MLTSSATPPRLSHSQMADLVVKTGVGLSVGVALSVILFKRRTWPVALATGFGMGQACWSSPHNTCESGSAAAVLLTLVHLVRPRFTDQNCDRSFNPYNVPGTRALGAADVKRA